MRNKYASRIYLYHGQAEFFFVPCNGFFFKSVLTCRRQTVCCHYSASRGWLKSSILTYMYNCAVSPNAKWSQLHTAYWINEGWIGKDSELFFDNLRYASSICLWDIALVSPFPLFSSLSFLFLSIVTVWSWTLLLTFWREYLSFPGALIVHSWPVLPVCQYFSAVYKVACRKWVRSSQYLFFGVKQWIVCETVCWGGNSFKNNADDIWSGGAEMWDTGVVVPDRKQH